MPSQKNLLARFALLEKAQACRDTLRAKGFDIVQIDNIPSAGSSQLENLGPLVEWGRYGYDVDRLDDKWTAASAWGQQDFLGGEDWLLTAVVPTDRAHEADQIIRQHGGQL